MSLFEKFKAAVAPKKENQSNGGPKIWPMNPEIAAKIQRGVRCNVKVVLRGMRKTGKSALLAALHGHAYPEVYSPSKEISAATIHWQKNKDDELGAKVEIWDVVDESPDTNQNGKLLRADATTIDVYRGCHCVVFMVDCTRPETLEYVRKEAVKLPPTIALLICLNFSDHPSGSKVVSERDCDTLCNSLPRSSTATVQQCCKGQPPPRQFSASPTWINLSLRTGSGMELLWNFFNIPVNMVRLEGLETQMKLLYQDIESVQADLLTMRAQQRFEAKEREKNDLIERSREREPSPVMPQAVAPPAQQSPARHREEEPGRIDQSFFAGISDDDDEETHSKPQRRRLSDSEDEPKPKADSRARQPTGKSQSSSTERKEASPPTERPKVVPTSQAAPPARAPAPAAKPPEPPKAPEPQKIDPTPGEGGRQVDRGFFDSDEEEPPQKPEVTTAKPNRRRLSDSDDEPVAAPAPRPKARGKKAEVVPEQPEVAKVTVDISALIQGMQTLVVDEPAPPIEKEKKRKEKSSKTKKEKKSRHHEEDDGDFEVQS